VWIALTVLFIIGTVNCSLYRLIDSLESFGKVGRNDSKMASQSSMRKRYVPPNLPSPGFKKSSSAAVDNKSQTWTLADADSHKGGGVDPKSQTWSFADSSRGPDGVPISASSSSSLLPKAKSAPVVVVGGGYKAPLPRPPVGPAVSARAPLSPHSPPVVGRAQSQPYTALAGRANRPPREGIDFKTNHSNDDKDLTASSRGANSSRDVTILSQDELDNEIASMEYQPTIRVSLAQIKTVQHLRQLFAVLVVAGSITIAFTLYIGITRLLDTSEPLEIAEDDRGFDVSVCVFAWIQWVFMWIFMWIGWIEVPPIKFLDRFLISRDPDNVNYKR